MLKFLRKVSYVGSRDRNYFPVQARQILKATHIQLLRTLRREQAVRPFTSHPRGLSRDNRTSWTQGSTDKTEQLTKPHIYKIYFSGFSAEDDGAAGAGLGDSDSGDNVSSGNKSLGPSTVSIVRLRRRLDVFCIREGNNTGRNIT